MKEFLIFKSFIAPYFFICCYYIGAIIIPLILFYKRKSIFQKAPLLSYFASQKEKLFNSLSFKYKILYIVFVVAGFIFLEIFWRIGFEFIIGYFELIKAAINKG